MNGIVRKDLCLNDCRLMVKRNQSRIDTMNDHGVKCLNLSEFKYIYLFQVLKLACGDLKKKISVYLWVDM